MSPLSSFSTSSRLSWERGFTRSIEFTARLALEQLRFFKTVGVFELKEHVATIGLILLPAYWAYWRPPLSQEYANARKQVTLLLAILVWSNFLTGHIVNNARGMGS
jgi:hypothetical protein